MRVILPTASGRIPVEPRVVRARMDTSMVQMVLHMGYSRELLHRVIERRLATVGEYLGSPIQDSIEATKTSLVKLGLTSPRIHICPSLPVNSERYCTPICL